MMFFHLPLLVDPLGMERMKISWERIPAQMMMMTSMISPKIGSSQLWA